MARRLGLAAGLSLIGLLHVGPAATAQVSQTAAGMVFDRLVPGFVGEARNANGYATGTAFVAPNPWGSYTAYRLSTDARGRRTWRIENYVPLGNFMQGSTMYLLEGDRKALLVDTAQESVSVAGKTDLKTVVRYLLGHNDDGSVRASPVDFVVANTHFHYDHTGENAQMADRTIYYPDLDWPERAPKNYVPIREGGGDSESGAGKAVGEIALGGRTIRAVDLHGHTPGSMGYLDHEHRLLITGDALGSSVVWMHFGPVSVYADALRHLRSVLAPIDGPVLLPAHFYQLTAAGRRSGPYAGRLLDKAYVDDQLAAATGAIDGTLVGEPYRVAGRGVALATVRSAGMTYSLDRLNPDPQKTGPYHAIRISSPPGPADPPSPIDALRSELYLIRDRAGNSLYLIRGSKTALLIGTGAGERGLDRFVARLIGGAELEVIVTSDDPGQVGGLRQFSQRKVYLPRGADIARRGLRSVAEVGAGDTIALGDDRSGRPVVLRVEPLSGHRAHGITLLSVNDRALFSGDALGAQTADGGLVLRGGLAEFAAALAAWRVRTDGAYDLVYTARNSQWMTAPAFVDRLQSAVRRALERGEAALSAVTASSGPADVVASVVVTGAESRPPRGSRRPR